MAKKEEVKEEKKDAAPKTEAKKEVKVAKTNEELVLELKKGLKEGEEPTVKVGGEEFTIKEVGGVDLVLSRKDYK